MDLGTQWWRERVGRTEKAAPDVRWIAGEKLHCSTGNPGWCSVMTWRGAVEKGREAQEGGMCV